MFSSAQFVGRGSKGTKMAPSTCNGALNVLFDEYTLKKALIACVHYRFLLNAPLINTFTEKYVIFIYLEITFLFSSSVLNCFSLGLNSVVHFPTLL